MSNSDLVNYAKESAKLSKKNNQKPVDKVRKCMYVNCPMSASTEAGGQYHCCFHESGHFHGEVTIAIKQNINLIKAYASMVKWSVPDWTNQKKWLAENERCPMKEDELPSVYLNRFFNWLLIKVKSDASILIEKK